MESKTKLSSALRVIADAIDEKRCEITDESADRIFNDLTDSIRIPINKAQALSLLNISRSTFDYRVRTGRYPQGIKRRGSSEKWWYRDELLDK